MTLATAADALGMSARSLRRDLDRAATTFTDLFDATRRSMAGHYINDTTLPFTEIAFLLGFSDTSAFSRAFRRWTGRAPRAWAASG